MKPKGAQFTQLPMFMRAGDLADPEKVGHMDSGGYKELGDMSSHEVMQRAKLGESMKGGSEHDTYYRQGVGRSLRDSIADEGVRNPVEMTHEKEGWPAPTGPRRLQVSDGHHRVFAAADVNPDMEIPLTYDFPDIDYTHKGALGDTPKWTDRTRNPDQPSPWK